VFELLQKELAERPTAERSPAKLGEAVGLSRSTIFRHLHASSSASSASNDVELRGQIQSVALEMRSYGYRPRFRSAALSLWSDISKRSS